MDFTANEEQNMLVDSASRFVDKEYEFKTRLAMSQHGQALSTKNWKLLADIGLTGLLVPNEQGGYGGNAVDAMLVMEVFGRGLVLEPFLSTCIMATSLLRDHGSAAQRQALLPSIAEGSLQVALAALETQSRYDLWDVRTTARPTEIGPSQHVLNGHKCVVVQGGGADKLIVSARTDHASTEPDGITLFLVDTHHPGVTIRSFPDIDGHRSADVRLQDVVVPASSIIGPIGGGHTLLEFAVDCGLAAICSEAVGAMQKLFDITVEYVSTREQFGQPIGRFQALQHRCAEMLAALEQARSATLMATASIDSDDTKARRKAVSAAKLVVSRNARWLGEQSLQLHGAIGMTDELAVGHYFKRLHSIAVTWGDAAHHAELSSVLNL